MSYIDLINAFEKWLETNYLPISSQLLWYKLISLFNRFGWCEWISVDNHRLMSILTINNEKTFIKCRDALINAKLFEYKRGKKGSPNQYKINLSTLKNVKKNTFENFYREKNTVKDTVKNTVKKGNTVKNTVKRINTVKITAHSTVYSTVKTTVKNTAIIRLKTKDNYINLYHKYKARLQSVSFWRERLHVLSELGKDNKYLELDTEKREQLFKELVEVRSGGVRSCSR